MGYINLEECIIDLERNGHLVRIREEVNPYLEMAAIHLRVFEKNGPALLFENVKGSSFRAVSNLFGTLERSHFIFRDTINKVKELIKFKTDPMLAFQNPVKALSLTPIALSSLTKCISKGTILENTCSIKQLPQIVNWPKDGGPFITLPAVYTEDPDKPGIMGSNIGMYRIQLDGNDYITDKEIGLHYQLHRGIGVHQSKWNELGKPMKVSIFIGGPPALPFSAVMPLPEGMPELTFAGALGNRSFRYTYDNQGFVIATDADFVITGEVFPGENKEEGPFGDHLGYYSLKHPFPLMHVNNVYHKQNAIWPFTVVGRPPQEDTAFGNLIHELTGFALANEIPGLKEIHAVDAAGVHPLLFAIGSERYTPYSNERKPAEILTIANHILGKGQLSLAKYLFICARENNDSLSVHHIKEYLIHCLSRIDFTRDLHFYTKTTIDTLDYSGSAINSGSKIVLAAAGIPLRELSPELPALDSLDFIKSISLVLPGILALKVPEFTNEQNAELEIGALCKLLSEDVKFNNSKTNYPMVVLCDDDSFAAKTIANFLWVTFTRSNPSHDIYGVNSFMEHKHWGCRGSLLIDARTKPHHAPELIKDEETENKIERFFKKGAVLEKWK